MRSMLLRAVAAGALLLTGASFAAAQSSDDAAGTPTPAPAAPETQATAAPSGEEDPVVAVVNGRELRRSDVLASAQSLPAPYQQQIDQIFPALVDRLIDLNLLAAEGRARKLEEDSTVRKMVAEFEDQAIREVLLQRYLDERLSDQAVKERYDELVASFKPQPEVRARHILVESKEEAQAVIKELEGGADFVQLAQSKSKGPSAAEGGDLGYFVAGQMLPEFADAAFAMKPGDISKEPIETQYGWHVIKVEDRRETEPPSFEEARPEIENTLSQELVTAFLTELREEAEIRRLDQPAPAAPAAGGAPAAAPEAATAPGAAAAPAAEEEAAPAD